MRLWGPESQRLRLTHEEEALSTDDAIRQVFLLTAEKFGLGLLVDDFGLCDQASQRFWLHLIQLVKKNHTQQPVRGLLLLASTRQPEKDSRCLGMPASTLAPLDKQASRQIVCQQLSALEIPNMLFSFLHEKAQGNPRFLQALTQYLLDHDFLEVINRHAHLKRELGTRRIPETLTELTEAKIEQCSNDAITFLGYACLLQQPFSANLIQQTTVHSINIQTALWECEQKGILHKSHANPNEWQFEQRRYREVIRAQMDAKTFIATKKGWRKPWRKPRVNQRMLNPCNHALRRHWRSHQGRKVVRACRRSRLQKRSARARRATLRSFAGAHEETLANEPWNARCIKTWL